MAWSNPLEADRSFVNNLCTTKHAACACHTDPTTLNVPHLHQGEWCILHWLGLLGRHSSCMLGTKFLEQLQPQRDVRQTMTLLMLQGSQCPHAQDSHVLHAWHETCLMSRVVFSLLFVL